VILYPNECIDSPAPATPQGHADVIACGATSPGFISDAYGCKIGDQRNRPMTESVATPIAANTKIARTRAAERMRRCRQRRRDGLRCYRLELRDSEIEALVRRGLLLATEQTNRNAVIKAVYEFFDCTLGRST